jgi:hypothetical protein
MRIESCSTQLNVWQGGQEEDFCCLAKICEFALRCFQSLWSCFFSDSPSLENRDIQHGQGSFDSTHSNLNLHSLGHLSVETINQTYKNIVDEAENILFEEEWITENESKWNAFPKQFADLINKHRNEVSSLDSPQKKQSLVHQFLTSLTELESNLLRTEALKEMDPVLEGTQKLKDLDSNVAKAIRKEIINIQRSAGNILEMVRISELLEDPEITEAFKKITKSYYREIATYTELISRIPHKAFELGWLDKEGFKIFDFCEQFLIKNVNQVISDKEFYDYQFMSFFIPEGVRTIIDKYQAQDNPSSDEFIKAVQAQIDQEILAREKAVEEIRMLILDKKRRVGDFRPDVVNAVREKVIDKTLEETHLNALLYYFEFFEGDQELQDQCKKCAA